MIMQFADRAVPYDAFINDLADRVAERMKPRPEFISQSEAFRQFGRANVERWRRTGKIQPHKRPGKVEYRTADLRRLQARVQDYFD